MPSDSTRLDEEVFATIVRHTPLVSLDIIIRDPAGCVLVGLRTYEPARAFYFVPGGRIRKDETIEAAFARIVRDETGIAAILEEARFLGVFQHFYPTNRFGRPGFGTHYVVLAHELVREVRPIVAADDQHASCKWLSVAELLAAADVHDHVKAYFT